MKISSLFFLFLRNLEISVRRILRLPPRPYKILLELTEHCNSRCETCSIWKPNDQRLKQQLSLPAAKSLFSSYGKNLLWIALSGGEITVYKNFTELIELIKTYCPNLKLITFTTNGLLPEKALDCGLQIQNLGVDHFITISLDGDEQLHDKIRGVQGNYQKAIQTNELLTAAGIKTHWGITLSELNSEFVKNQNPLLQKIKAVTFAHSDGIYLQKNSPSNKLLMTMIKSMISIYKISNLSEFFEWIYIRLSFKFVLHQKKVLIPCEVISSSLHIKADGKVHPCMFVDEIGQLQQQSLPEILKNPNLQEKMKAYRKGQCPGCWMNCYAPHSMLQHPVKSIYHAFSGFKKEDAAT